ncbi:hypothetical protein RFI_17534 [Reticulomyxa filosa]|uniref:Caspase family p20 domain-containing protein n=1 Tax=Reticulomyxa filosa TaxID=46433 RepID=X6N0T9_RETFI|nr:hypothetical protein RFI_17534 [Reticulomyxa filosa]|eukprot:ETO19696.1 hypothetical protein RFI_17534 [Reticulomyxa filosa]
MKWWNQREQKDKTEIIEKFKTMSNEQFGIWLLKESKWRHEITKDDINFICFSIDAYIEFVMTSQDNKEEEEVESVILLFYSYEKKKLIRMKKLTFEELLHQSYYCLEAKHFQKMNNENVKLQLVDMKNNIIETDEDVMKEFENSEPTYKIAWISFQRPVILGKVKTIKNALVILIAISEYDNNNKWKNLKNVKEKDITNFKQLFEQEMNYEMVCNPSPKMTKDDVDEFIEQTKFNFKLRKNTSQYDGLIIIICGHGEDGNMLVASDGKYIFQKFLLLILAAEKMLQNLTKLQCEEMKDYVDIVTMDF